MKITLSQIVLAGIHLGHPKRILNPKIRTFTYGIINGSYLIDIIQTRKQITKARKFITRVIGDGKHALFVGTKDQAASAIKEVASSSQTFFVNERWVGGMLTNWSTIRTSLFLLHRLEHEKDRGLWNTLPQKKVASLQKRLTRIQRYLGGLKGIRFYPGVVVIVGQPTEMTTIQECNKLKIATICRLDTDCDPSLVEIGVGINDDSRARIRLFLEAISLRIQRGRRNWLERVVEPKQP